MSQVHLDLSDLDFLHNYYVLVTRGSPTDGKERPKFHSHASCKEKKVLKGTEKGQVERNTIR